jgi:tRNA nucleotidyltransferase (CCA-adding enzyme)
VNHILGETIFKAIKQCKPSCVEANRLKSVAEQTLQLVKSYNSPKIVETVFGGSFAKGTWLKCDADIDIFVKIAVSTSLEEFEELGKRIGLKSLRQYRPSIRYSSHPYVEAYVRGVRVNVVPCYDVEKGRWKSAADRSPFHTQHIIDNLDQEEKDQVRILKKFLKGCGVYGAEIATSGFSGYVTEVLILKFGSFRAVLEEISNMKAQSGSEKKQVISVEKVDEDTIKTFDTRLIIIDPVDPKRNLGAAISAESIGRFVLAARTFLARPSLDYFVESRRSRKYAHRFDNCLYQNLLVIEFTYSMRSPDVIWGQLKKSLRALSKQLEIADFKVIRSTCSTDEKKLAAFVFLLESSKLWPYRDRIGPEILMKNATDNFILKNQNNSILMWIDDEMRIRNLVKRNQISAKHYLSSLLTEHIKISGITSGLIGDVAQSFQIYTGDERRIKGIPRDAINKIIAHDLIR